MRRLLSIFLCGFLLDALLSVPGDWPPLAVPRALVAWGVFVASLALLAIAAFDSRLPKRLVLPPAIFLVWANVCGGFPLAFLAPDSCAPVLSWCQLALAAALLALHRRWRRTPPPVDRPAFSWRRLALIALPALAALPIVLLVACVNMLGVGMEQQSGGYVKLRPGGLMLEERELSKDDRHVRLVSMMHIGERDFYDRVLASLPARGAVVVLVEGVTDKDGLLKGRFSYARLAKLLGLASQETSEFQKQARAGVVADDSAGEPGKDVRYLRADVDISTFNPLTLAYITSIATILSDPTAETVSRVITDPNAPFKQPGIDRIVMRDILQKRNEHLVSEIDDALKNSKNVVVPWGALHLPYIEAALKAQGFQETRRTDRTVMRFWRAPEDARKQ